MTDSTQRIKELHNILEATKLLNASRDLDFILKELMNTALRLIKRADIGIIFLYDKSDDLLKSKFSFGFDDMKVSLKPGESITGITFNQKSTLHLTSPEEVHEAMSSMSSDTKEMLHKRIIRPMDNLLSAISCPLIHEEECIGVLVLDNYMGGEPFTEDDVYLAELISVQATIAIRNAENYSREIEAQNSLKEYSQLVEMEKNRYQYSTFLHNKFTEMILNRNSSDDIIREVSQLLQTDIFIIDLFYTIVSYAGNHHEMRDELEDIKRSILKYMSSEGETIHYNNDLHLWIMLYPIFVSGDVFGWIGMLMDEDHLSELDRIVVEKCSNVVALEILKDYDMSNLEQSIRGDYFDNLLKGNPMNLDNKFHERYRIDFSHPHRMILVNLVYQKKDNPAYKYFRYFYQAVNALALQTFKRSLAIQKRNLIIILIDDNDSFNREIMKTFHKSITETVEKLESRAKIHSSCVSIVSEKINSYDEFRSIYERTYKLFEIIPGNQTSDCHFYEDYQVKKILLKNDKHDLVAFSRKVLAPVFDYSHSSRIELFETLKTYIFSGGNWTKTKNDLHIHGNTLTYRLNRIKELMDADIDDYQTRLRIQLALEITEIYNEILDEIK
ncbi:helix-turn-helix domain-containing protein [Gudongella sp. SC589]|jgi:sugar diacid utilization regulator|uniref:helix-turn-helix domain-containing protein n=1 Tax=Gudongella sp. SC589 TaxID=3385990 RepID=UPI003904D40F